MIAYFVGVHPCVQSGHYCYASGFAQVQRAATPSPWQSNDRDPLAEFTSIAEARNGLPIQELHQVDQREGRPLLLHRDGWTLLGFWDRSADRRGNSCSCFAFSEVLALDEAIAAARQHFPGVIERIERHLGRALTDKEKA